MVDESAKSLKSRGSILNRKEPMCRAIEGASEGVVEW